MPIDEEARAPTLPDIFEAFAARAVTYISAPGRVTRYDAARGLVDVQPLLRKTVEGEDGSVVSQELPVIPNVPIMFMGASSFRQTFPIPVGTGVLLVFCHQSIDRWLESDGSRTVDPDDTRRGSLSDCYAIPGATATRAVPATPATDRMVVGHVTGARVRISATEVAVDTGSGAVSLALKSDVDELRAKLLSHTHPYSPGPGAVTPTGPTATAVALMAGTDVLLGK